jgi:hypothetical protein
MSARSIRRDSSSTKKSAPGEPTVGERHALVVVVIVAARSR